MTWLLSLIGIYGASSCLLVAILVVVAGGARRLRLRRRAVRVRSGLSRPRASLDEIKSGERVALLGTLRFLDWPRASAAPGVLVSHVPCGGELAETPIAGVRTESSAGTPSVLVGAHAVELDGPLQVLVGARETGRRRTWERFVRRHGLFGPLSAGVPEGWVRLVREGDRVWVEGELVAEGGDAPHSSYRERSVVYRLRASSGEGLPARPIALAFAATPRPLGRSRGLVAFAIVLSAAALGGSQSWRKAMVRHADGEKQAERACLREVDQLLEQSDPWAAREKLPRCPDVARQARLAWSLGDFRGASEAFTVLRDQTDSEAKVPPSLSEIEAHVIAGRLWPAADAAGALLRTSTTLSPADRLELGCVQAALASRAAGGKVGKAHLFAVTEATPPHHPCSLLGGYAAGGPPGAPGEVEPQAARPLPPLLPPARASLCWTCGIGALASHTGERMAEARRLGDEARERRLGELVRATARARTELEATLVLSMIEALALPSP